MGKLLCEKNLRDVWCRNEGVRAEIGQILHTHTHTRLSYSSNDTNYMEFNFFIAPMYQRAYIYLFRCIMYLVPTGLTMDRHVFTVICPFL